jgi:hypothetical protein
VRDGIGPANVMRAVLLAGFAAMLALSWPGHLTYDSVSQLAEGRAGEQQTWAPAMYAWILGAFDRIRAGTGLYLVASALLLLAALWSLPALRGRASWAAVLVAVVVAASPALLLYQGIVWKDVLFANLTVAGFVALAHAAEAGWRGARAALLLAAAGLAFGVAALVRQNGLVVLVIAAVTLTTLLRPAGWSRALAAGVGGFAAVFLLSQLLGAAVQPPNADPGRRTDIGLRILLHYDILGATAHDPSLPLSQVDAVRPAMDDLIRARARLAYSPERVEGGAPEPELRRSFWRAPPDAMKRQWLEILTRHPSAYLAHRWDVFRQVFLTPDIHRCLPIAVGVEGAPAQLASLGLTAGTDAADLRLADYARRLTATPYYSHAAHALVAAVLMVLLLIRRSPADMAIAGLLAAGLAVAASYFAISIACDYRYLYVLDLSALTGLLYVALDPSLRRASAATGRRRGSA